MGYRSGNNFREPSTSKKQGGLGQVRDVKGRSEKLKTLLRALNSHQNTSLM